MTQNFRGMFHFQSISKRQVSMENSPLSPVNEVFVVTGGGQQF